MPICLLRSATTTRVCILSLSIALGGCSADSATTKADRSDAASFGGSGVGGSGAGPASAGMGGGDRPDASRAGFGGSGTPGGGGRAGSESDARADVGVRPTADAGPLLDAALDARPTTGVDGGPACRRFATDAALERQRNACSFAKGAKVAQTLESAAQARSSIEHLIVVTHENRSMDHMYGTIGHGIEGFPASYTNLDSSGKPVSPTHLTSACPPDISHSIDSITAEWDNGKMDGFVKTDGLGAFGYYEPADHPFYSWLITTFAAADHNFCSTLGATGENRRFLYGASANANGSANIITEMNAAKVDWGDYFVGSSPIYNTFSLPANFPGAHPYADFLPALDAGTLPSVVFVDTPSDEHPPGSMKTGEGVIHDIVSHAVKSPLWKHLAIVFNYDEGGGFFDHVPPPPACPPTTAAADAAYTVEGIRVPLIVISPYARKAYVSHLHHSHTSVPRLIELLHDLPAISARDANSDALLDMFDFDCPDFVTPPTLPPKPPGGC